jgi:NAD-dependent oxidoreductase involved in siderophore biosynthesis
LEVVAEVFRSPLPEKQAFKLYVAVLQDLPAVAFKEACRQIVRTHRYPNLPLPAEFIEAAQPIIKQMNGWKQRLELAVSRI